MRDNKKQSIHLAPVEPTQPPQRTQTKLSTCTTEAITTNSSFSTKASRNFFALTFHVIVACFFVFRNELTRPPTTEKRSKWALTQSRHVQLSIEEVKRENKNLTRSRRLLLSTPVFSVLLFVTCHFKKFLYQVAFWWMWKETYLFHFCVPPFYSNQTPPPA